MTKYWRQKQGLLVMLVLVCAAVFVWGCSAQGQGAQKAAKDAALQVLVYPEKYTPAVSSVPGIRLQAVYGRPVAKVRYATERGMMLTWDAQTGRVSEGKIAQNISAVEVPYGMPAYWYPLEVRSKYYPEDENIVITITLLDEQDKQIGREQLQVLKDNGFYAVKPGEGVTFVSSNLERAVSLAVLGRQSTYAEGETATEGHIILETEEERDRVKVYAIASNGAFAFENGIFTKVSGSGAIPTVITLAKAENGEYYLLEYQEPMDGAGYGESIKKMFPRRLHDRVLSSKQYNDYAELVRQQEEQAAAYLKSIGRDAPVQAAHVKKELADINVEASNKIFAELTKYDAFLNNCPYWLGTRERVEDGIRYIYETSLSKTQDGYDLIVFRKTREDGRVVKEAKYKIVGSEPQLLP